MMRGQGMRLHNAAAPGVWTAATPYPVSHAHFHAVAATQVQSAAMTAYGGIYGAYPPLVSYRFSPYLMQTMAPGVSAPPQSPSQSIQSAPLPPSPEFQWTDKMDLTYLSRK